MTGVHLWYTLPTKDYLKGAVVSSLSDTVETYTESVEEGDEEDFNELLKGIISRAFEYGVKYGLAVNGRELIAPACGNLIDFFEDVALSIVYAGGGKDSIIELMSLPVEVNPLRNNPVTRNMSIEEVFFPEGPLKLFFGTFDLIKFVLYRKHSKILEIESPDNGVTVRVGVEEYVEGIREKLIRGVHEVEEALKTFTPLRALYPKIQWAKVVARYALSTW